MANKKVYEPEIVAEVPYPTQDQAVIATTNTSSNPAGTYTPTTVKDKALPKKRAAVELISQVLNTRSRKVLQEFDLQQSGGFKIGEFQQGVSGDVKISPNGLVGRNNAGLTTFALDTDGNLVLVGEIRSGSLITGDVIVGDNRIRIEVDDDGRGTIIVNDGQYDRVLIGFGDF